MRNGDDIGAAGARRARRGGEEQVADRLGLVCRRRWVGRERRRKEEREEERASRVFF